MTTKTVNTTKPRYCTLLYAGDVHAWHADADNIGWTPDVGDNPGLVNHEAKDLQEVIDFCTSYLKHEGFTAKMEIYDAEKLRELFDVDDVYDIDLEEFMKRLDVPRPIHVVEHYREDDGEDE